MTEETHNDIYEKIGALSSSINAVQRDVSEVKSDVKEIRDSVLGITTTVAKWSGGIAVIATLGISWIKDYFSKPQ